MIRPLLGALGLVTALVPDQIVDLFEAVAVKNPDEITVHSWFTHLIRVEGVVIVLAALRDGRLYAWLMNLTGLFGAVLVLVPGLYERIAGPLVYEDPGSVEWHDHLSDGIRVIGVVYGLLALLNQRRTES
ncbi:Uncharacterized protein AArcCO_4016 (plasmid) [Halalkaliarchaeum sp. AArc-CO]|uniref:hypothetical protein n=1 Tax=Halalkaliarchaeum sp. AArc-CO TaxID=2866381 RepID=UPI00217D9025|nr:hypothetical protein [Halalkaliarchaeum sp. AArc-CO]UWG49191.1 Uncharacterized protein AArcCO_4016 [Halalkaliarchaeum sp. AArc-CO]